MLLNTSNVGWVDATPLRENQENAFLRYDLGMISIRAAALIFISAFGCMAQSLVPSIELSPEAATHARQAWDDLQRAQTGNNAARAAWKNFAQAYQTAHPDLPDFHFTTDLSAAIAILNPQTEFPRLTALRLTPEERRQATTLHRSLDDSQRALVEARANWKDLQEQLGADAPSDYRSWSDVTLRSGKQVRVFHPWSSGLVFTDDFRLATPLIYPSF